MGLKRLQDLIKPKPLKVEFKDSRKCNIPISTIKIPIYEKRIMEPEAPLLVIETKPQATRIIFKAWFTAFLTKHPHFKYLYATKSNWSNNKQIFWFLNTENNVKVLLTKEEILERNNLTKRQTKGFINYKLTSKDKDEIIVNNYFKQTIL
jgi:hypothetical protein